MKKQASPWTNGFLFLGNQLALDFLNTHPIVDGAPVELLPDFSALLRWLLAGGWLSEEEVQNLQKRWGKSARARRTVHAARDLRETLRREVVASEHGKAVHSATVQELNRLMALHPMKTRLKLTGSGPAMEPWFEARVPEDLLAPVAYNAAELFAHADRGRIRKCASCVVHFYDTSKKGTRRWCSMQLCGNRAKAAAFAARQR